MLLQFAYSRECSRDYIKSDDYWDDLEQSIEKFAPGPRLIMVLDLLNESDTAIVPPETLHNIYNLVQSHFDYCSVHVVWGMCGKSLADKLQT